MSSTRKTLRYVACVVIGLALARGVAAEGTHARTREVRWDLQVANVHQLYGVDVLLTYDGSAVEVIDADLDRPGVQIEPGSLFTGQPYFVAYNRATVNHSTGVGTISFVATLLNPAEPIDGDGVAATIRYRVIDSSVSTGSPFTIQEAYLASRGGRRMLVEWEGNVIRQVFRVYLPLLAAYPSIPPPQTQPARGVASVSGRPACGRDGTSYSPAAIRAACVTRFANSVTSGSSGSNWLTCRARVRTSSRLLSCAQ